MLKDSPLRLVKLTDELKDILTGCARDRRDSQEKLYRLFSAKMFGVCLRYCTDYNDAKDVLQDGFVKVFENIKKFEYKGSFEGWVRKIIVNTALEKIRKSKPIIFVENVPEMMEEEDNEVEFDISLNEMLDLVQKLPSQYRLVFNLYVFEEMTHKEIAQKLGITDGTSKSNLSRARALLQQKLKFATHKVVKIG